MEKNDNCLQLGTFLIDLIFFSIVITTTLFYLNITVTPINFIFSVFCSSVICFYSNKNIKRPSG